MSVFTGKVDWGLPTLTWVSQIDTESDDELRALAGRYDKFAPPLSPEKKPLLVEAINLSKSIMNDLFDHASVHYGNLQGLRNYVNNFAIHDVVFVFASDKWEEANLKGVENPNLLSDAQLMVPTSELFAINGRATVDTITYVINDIQLLVLSYWNNEGMLGRCDECRNVFVPIRNTRRFCSHRCQSRAAKKRRQLKK